MLHGKGRFVKRVLEPHMVREDKHLMLPLYMAERAWAYAMALKRENTAQESRPRFHLLARLRKAAKWSAVLSSLCAKRHAEPSLQRPWVNALQMAIFSYKAVRNIAC